MMSRFRQSLRVLGKSGTAFLVGILLFAICYLIGFGVGALFVALALVPVTLILLFRGFKWVKRHSLWSLRNRLLLVYTLIGVLPVALLLLLIGLGTWSLMSELAIYLASSALDRRLESLQVAAEGLQRTAPDVRVFSVPHFSEAFERSFPGILFYYTDAKGEHSFPSNAPLLKVSPQWGNVHGLLVWNRRFYGWAHSRANNDQVTVLAPLSNETIEDLVPNLGSIGLIEADAGATGKGAVAGSMHLSTDSDNRRDPTISVRTQLPAAVNRFDVPVFWPSTQHHYHLDTPDKTYPVVLWVESRPSAVLRTFFSGTEDFRGFLFDTVIAVALLFLLVELAAIWFGVRLSRRITGAVGQLYDGTQRVTHGDFHNRIPVRDSDQLGELSLSFNQMTENLERLMVIEKEKERLQTEIEIAREVQSQLYPKEAPPTCGLKLTVRCDPARMVSGDYYDYLDIGNGKLAFAIGDVAGKGISAALLMATLQAALRAQITDYESAECNGTRTVNAAKLVSALNKQIYANTAPEKYATFFFGVFDEPTRTLTYTNAGHLSPLLFRKNEVITLDSNGTVVGAFPFAKYDESCLSVTPGDLLVCYTDGITEPANAYDEMFGEERLIELIHKYINRDDHEIVALVLEAVRSWTGTPELQDDMTLLLAREIET